MVTAVRILEPPLCCHSTPTASKTTGQLRGQEVEALILSYKSEQVDEEWEDGRQNVRRAGLSLTRMEPVHSLELIIGTERRQTPPDAFKLNPRSRIHHEILYLINPTMSL
jgi:hypothetical protein